MAAAKILAAIHTGAIEGLHCSDCSSQLQEDLNCYMSERDDYVFDDEELDLSLGACPIRYITLEAQQYYDEWQYNKMFSSVPFDYKSITYRRWEFFKEYQHYLHKFEAMMIEKRSHERQSVGGNTDQNLSTLKNQFLGKK